jgi:hypothetical protein
MLISSADAYAPPVRLEEEVTQLFEQLRDPLFRYLLSFGLSVQDGSIPGLIPAPEEWEAA